MRLALTEAAAGTLSATARHSDIQSLVHQLIASAAAKQGVEINDTRLIFTSLGPRALSFEAELTAKMFLMRAKLVISGTLRIEDNLSIGLSDLACRGDGMIANAASGLLKPHFEKAQSQKLSLSAIIPLGLGIREITLAAGASMEIAASFGAPR